MVHEFIPKKVSRKKGKQKYRTEGQKKRRYAKEKRIRGAKRDLRLEEESLLRFASAGAKDQFDKEVAAAKIVFTDFMQRTGRMVDIDRLNYHASRRGQHVLKTIESEYPLKGRTWLNLVPGRGHRPGLSQSQLRHICVILQVKYWREMSTDEMRAVLFLLVWMNKVDPEKYFWNEGDLG